MVVLVDGGCDVRQNVLFSAKAQLVCQSICDFYISNKSILLRSFKESISFYLVKKQFDYSNHSEFPKMNTFGRKRKTMNH